MRCFAPLVLLLRKRQRCLIADEAFDSSYAGLWALRNPFTELVELTNGMAFLHDDLDREIVDTVTGKEAQRRMINLNAVRTFTPPLLSFTQSLSLPSSAELAHAFALEINSVVSLVSHRQ